jgi:polysaccharide biosynthesis protein PslH
MRILFVSPRQSWPPVTGAKLREYYLARALGRHAELTYVFFREPGLAEPTTRDLPFCRRILTSPKPRPYGPLSLARGIIGRWPLPVLNYTSAGMRQVLEGVVRESQFDLVHLDAIHMAGYEEMLRRALPQARIVYDWHNIESELMGRYSSQAKPLPKKLYAAITARRLERAETRILGSAYGHVVCSERERKQLLARVPNARIEVIGNGVDVESFREGEHWAGVRNSVVFVGSMNYHANVDAAVWFAQQIWPGIRKRFPDLKLMLVGSDPTPSVAALRELPGIEVTGTVPDVRPYYTRALAAVVPLRTGGGTRLKILEAMAAGVPVISTAIGAEGLAVSPGKNILIVDHDPEWIAALESIADQSMDGRGERWKSLAAAGQSLVESRYDWNVLGGALYETYLRWSSASNPSA